MPQTLPGRHKKMRRKTRPSPLTPTVKTEEEVNELVPAPTDSIEPVKNTENAEITENAENTTSTEIVVRNKRRIVRRPTFSDTVSAIPVAAFQRMVRHMAEDYRSDLRWEDEALQALQADAEAFLVERFQKAKKTTDLFGRSTTSREFACLLQA